MSELKVGDRVTIGSLDFIGASFIYERVRVGAVGVIVMVCSSTVWGSSCYVLMDDEKLRSNTVRYTGFEMKKGLWAFPESALDPCDSGALFRKEARKAKRPMGI